MRAGKLMLATIAMVVIPAAGAHAANGGMLSQSSSGGDRSRDDVEILAPNLTITKIADRDPVGIDEEIRWTITVTNSGSEGASFGAGEPLLRDDLPAGLTGVSASGGVYGCVPVAGSPQTLLCSATANDVIAPDETRVVTITATAPSVPGTLTNRAVVDPAGIVTESNEHDNVAYAVTTVKGKDDDDEDDDGDTVRNRVNVRAGIVPASDEADAGEELTWTIRALNAGRGNVWIPAGTTLVRVTVPDMLADASLTGDGFTCTADGTVWECTADERTKIKHDAPPVFTLTGTAPETDAVLIVRVLVDPSDVIDESDESDNAATSVVTVQAEEAEQATFTSA